MISISGDPFVHSERERVERGGGKEGRRHRETERENTNVLMKRPSARVTVGGGGGGKQLKYRSNM